PPGTSTTAARRAAPGPASGKPSPASSPSPVSSCGHFEKRPRPQDSSTTIVGMTVALANGKAPMTHRCEGRHTHRENSALSLAPSGTTRGSKAAGDVDATIGFLVAQIRVLRTLPGALPDH